MVVRRKVEASGALGAKGQYPLTVNPWMVIKTKTKCEKFVRDKIHAMGMDAFVPLKKRTAKYNRKVKVSKFINQIEIIRTSLLVTMHLFESQ